jgi:glycosyltransferase involved in cell wall biosynthesis
MPKVSVIIPAYNAMPYLPETVASVLNQTYRDFEVLIVDDASTDSTLDWLSNVTDPRIRIITQANQGTPGARNTGIINASGEYLAFLDADDLWEPIKLESQVNLLDANPEIGLVDTWASLVDEDGNPLGKVIESDADGYVFSKLIVRNTICCGSTPMVRRLCFEEVGVFSRELLFTEDWDMWIRISLKYQFGLIRESLVSYRQHSKSKSKNWRGMSEDSLAILYRVIKIVDQDKLQLVKNAISGVYVYRAWWSLDEGDYCNAAIYLTEASKANPNVQKSWKFIRLRIDVVLMQLLGVPLYSKVRVFARSLRQQGSFGFSE